MFSKEPGPESLTWLDEKYQSAAMDPKTPLRCNVQAGDAEIRDAFRKICIEVILISIKLKSIIMAPI